MGLSLNKNNYITKQSKGGKLYYILPPLFVFCILNIVFYIFNLFPFSQNTIGWGDLNQQVMPFLLNLKEVILGNKNIFFNMSYADGMNFWGVFLFFLSSPFSFLVLFIKSSEVSTMLNILVMLKLMVCSITAYYFFNNMFKFSKALKITLSVMYSFSGFALLFYQNMMWLDVMYVFPLLVLGMYKLIHTNSKTLYIVSLSAIIILNFYLSYMIFIFIIIACGIYIFTLKEKDKIKKAIIHLFYGTSISLLITAVIWIPSFVQYLSSGRTTSIIESLSSGSFITDWYTTLPLLFCTASLCLICFLFKKKNLPAKTLILFALLIIPIFIDPINKMWHTGSYQAFPVRYGYISVFIGLVLIGFLFDDIKKIRSEEKNNIKTVLAVYFIVAISILTGACLLIYKLDEMRAYTKTLWGNLESYLYLLFYFIVLSFAFILIFILCRKRQMQKTFIIAFCILAAFECFFNSSLYLGSVSNNTNHFRQVVDLANRIENPQNVKCDEKYFDVNLLGAIGYNNIAHYSSLQQEDYMFTAKKLGYSSYWMEVGANGSTVFGDIFMANNHTISNRENFFKKSIYSNGKYYIHENAYKGNYANFVSRNPKELTLLNSSRIQVQNDLFKKIYNSNQNLFTEHYQDYTYNIIRNTSTISVGNQDDYGVLEYYIDVDKKVALYIDLFDKYTNNLKEPIYESINVYVNDVLHTYNYPSQSKNGILDLGEYEYEDVKITIEINKSFDAMSFGLYSLNYNILDKYYSTDNFLDVKMKENSIYASGFADEDDKTVYLNIPYNNGFEASVNGEKAEIHKVFDNFIGLEVNSGHNEIKLTFTPPFLKISLFFSILGIILFICSMYKKNTLKAKNKYVEMYENVLYYAFASLFCIVFIVIYIMPILIYVLFFNTQF